MREKNENTAQVIGHMVRFLPKEEKPHRSGNATTVLHPKIGAFVLVVVDDPKHYHALSSRMLEKPLDQDADPGSESTAPIMAALQKAYPFGTMIKVRAKQDDRTNTMRYSLIEKN